MKLKTPGEDLVTVLVKGLMRASVYIVSENIKDEWHKKSGEVLDGERNSDSLQCLVFDL